MVNASSINKKELLTLNNLSTGYHTNRNKFLLHSEIDTHIAENELIALLGPNGAGKSTLMRTLAGMHPSLNGSVVCNGKDINHMSNRERARNIAMVLTDKIDDRYLTAVDIVGTGRYPHGSFMGKLNSQKDMEIISNAIELVGANEFKDRYFYTLSDGEKQRVMIARAIAQDTPLIFLDEPTAFIDSPGKVQIINLLGELVKNHNKSILLTTHDTELALNYASKLWLLGKENMFIVGKPDKLVNDGVINKLFDIDGVSFNKRTRRFESIG